MCTWSTTLVLVNLEPRRLVVVVAVAVVVVCVCGVGVGVGGAGGVVVVVLTVCLSDVSVHATQPHAINSGGRSPGSQPKTMGLPTTSRT